MKIKSLWMGFMVVLTAGTAAAQTTPSYFGAPDTTVATISLCGQDSLLLGVPISAGVSEVPLVHLDWKTSCSEYPGWLQVGYDDSGWDGPYFEGCGDGNLIQQALYCGNEDYLIWGRPECDAVFLRLTLSDFKGQLVGMQLGVDDVSTVYINGQEVLGTLTWEICHEIDLTQHLDQEVNVIALRASDIWGCQGVFGKFQIERSATWSDGLQSGTRWVSEPGVYTLTVVDGTGVAVYIYEVIGSDVASAGCTDAQACNYMPEAICGDGSCIYPPDGAADCMVGETFCGPGQTWNPTLQQCIIATSNGGGLCGVGTVWDSGAGVCVPWVACPDLAYNPDVDADGVIGVIDLLGLLVLFDDQDSDGDGIFDSMDDCFGVLDGCGVCGGVGVDLDADGVCDDVDPCVGSVDVVGVCGGACVADADGDGVCDDVDSCVGELDACGVCNGPGAVYSCGCVELEPNVCNCDGDVLDALGVCGGACEADADADGLCDDVDPCVGALDECGVCNGPGPSVPILDQVVFVTDSVFIPPLNSWYVFSYPVDTLYTYVCPVLGCTDTEAPNFNPLAVLEDGSCLYGPAQCGGQSTVTFDGYTYDLVGIGSQCWFKENLRSDHYRNGDAIPGELNDSDWSSTTNGAQAVYDNDASNLSSFGRLYNWHAVLDSRGLCPTGWHVPSDAAWQSLASFLGGAGVAGNLMKATGEDLPAWDGTNESGFRGLPSGRRYIDGSFVGQGGYGSWWTSTINPSVPIDRYAYSGNSSLGRFVGSHPQDGFGVRCLKDLESGSCFDPDADGICAEDEVSGCTDSTASNFNPEATEEDDSCEFPGPYQCGGQSTVTFDGHTYNLVGIGTQCWFKENLRSDNYRNGDAIPGNLSDSDWSSTTNGAQVVYNNDMANLATYGRLYNWHAVSDSRGLCPTGFHVPSDGEWMTLEISLGMPQGVLDNIGFRGTDQGTQMKSSFSDNPSWNGSNSSGFKGIPAGDRTSWGSYLNLGGSANWWSSSSSGGYAIYRNLGNESTQVYRRWNTPQSGFSVRCIRD